MNLVTTDVRIDDHGAIQMLAEFPAQAKLARLRALTRTADWCRTRTLEAITGADGLTLKKSDLDGRHRFGGVKSTKATQAKEEARVEITGGRIPLFLFGGRPKLPPTPRGISYQITRNGGGKRIAHNAFTAKMKTGHVGFFRRRDSALRFTKGPKLGKFKTLRKIQELYGPSVPHVAEQSPAFQQLLHVDSGARLELELERQVNYIITGSSKGAAHDL